MWCITVTGNGPGHSQPDDPVGIIGLVPRAGHDERRAASAQREARCANTPVMDDRGCPWKKLRERGVITCHDPVGQTWESVSCIVENQNRPTADLLCCRNAVLVEASGIIGDGSSHRKDNGRETVVKKPLQIRRHAASLVEKWKARDNRLRGPVGLF